MRSLLFIFLTAVGLLAGCAATPEENVGGEASDLTGDENQVAAIKRLVKDVDEEHVSIPEGITAPTIDASTGAESENASLFGIDWYQKWAGGKSADHEWSSGSARGQRCAWASIARFEILMADAPPELAKLRAEYKDWDGAFTNSNEDYGGTTKDGKPAYGDAKTAKITTTPSGTVKWVSATAKDGSCFLPTKAMLVAYAKSCSDKKSIASCGE